MTAKRAPGSRSPSQSARLTNTTANNSSEASGSAKTSDRKTVAFVTGSSPGKNTQASSTSVAGSSAKSTQSRGTVASSSSGKRNGGRTQPRSEDALEHQEMKQVDDVEVPMDFPREQIKLGKEFGVGDFGKVFQAEAKKLLPRQKKTTVVVKQLKEGATKEERDVFLRPVEAMK